MDTINDTFTVWYALLTGSFLTATIAVALAAATVYLAYGAGAWVGEKVMGR